jgi:hypothetical protein
MQQSHVFPDGVVGETLRDLLHLPQGHPLLPAFLAAESQLAVLLAAKEDHCPAERAFRHARDPFAEAAYVDSLSPSP